MRIFKSGGKSEGLTGKDVTALIENFIVPGVKAEIRVQETEQFKQIQKQLGFSPSGFFSFPGICPPRFSVSERVDAIAAHLGLVFDRTDAVPAKVILRKPDKKKDGTVIYRKKSLKAGGAK